MRPHVVVVGSGAAGLVAALAARHNGAEVTVLEATSTLGGTTALSSGAVWVPNNHVEAGGLARDRTEDAYAYLDVLALGDVDPGLVARFIEQAPRALRWLAATGPLSFHLLPYPDCHPEFRGGKPGGRCVEPGPLPVDRGIAAILRAPLPWRPPATLGELAAGALDPDVLAERRRTGTTTGGQALVAGLLTAALEAGVAVRTGARATGLLRTGDAVTGVHLNGTPIAGRVVLASGGFERDAVLVRSFLRMPVSSCVGAPGARGDGLRMAMSAGAALGNMSEAWWCPTTDVPGDEIDGQPVSRMLFAERARPGAVLVDRRGRRFTNEAHNYNDVGRAMHAFDPVAFRFERDPSWLVFDGRYRASYPAGAVRPDRPDPEWLACGATLAELAGRIDVDGRNLTETVDRFNAAAAAGHDPEFGRGTSAYDRAMGDPLAPHPTLGPLTEPPFYAIRVRPGLGGTKGGPRIDGRGRVLRVEGQPVPGLYAAGNAAASPFGLAYPGTGATLGQALVFGVLAGESAAAD